METRKLILVKHSLPDILPNVPPDEWHLSSEGRARCARLADRLAEFRLANVASSPEPKAVETAHIVSERLGLSIQIVAELYEQRRRQARYTGQPEFESQIAQLFAQPDRLSFGEETADQAHARFANAVKALVASTPEGNIGIIAHGTIITLFVSRACRIEPFPLWKRLGLPSFVVLDLLEYRLNAVVDQV